MIESQKPTTDIGRDGSALFFAVFGVAILVSGLLLLTHSPAVFLDYRFYLTMLAAVGWWCLSFATMMLVFWFLRKRAAKVIATSVLTIMLFIVGLPVIIMVGHRLGCSTVVAVFGFMLGPFLVLLVWMAESFIRSLVKR